MEIIKTKNDHMKPSTLFNMTRGANRIPLRQCDSDRLELVEWVIFTDVMNDGTVMECVSLKDADGVTWTTNGATFVRDFEACAGACERGGETLDEIIIIERQSKKGRSFRTCILPED